MGLGSTTKKIQSIADTAEQMYQRLNDLRVQVESTQQTVQTTGEKVQTLESEIVEQRAILTAIAEELDIDLDRVQADAHITEAETDAEASNESDSNKSDTDEITDAEEDDTSGHT
ncbi:DUF5798 family protein [Halalkalirubrum salinum]|uniref:DUF5798 family protein n=1 Tax=Halalkalirubrum salinum TaxID=2563889 RepID=UPI0010FB3A48|nr:DUF5798 family protein [Halalkalirubrum salinum]